MGFLSTLTSYNQQWNEVNREGIDADELKTIKSIEVTEHEFEWGTAVSFCFAMTNGAVKYAFMSRDCELEVGDAVDPNSVEFIELERDGETCLKVTGSKLKPSNRGRRN